MGENAFFLPFSPPCSSSPPCFSVSSFFLHFLRLLLLGLLVVLLLLLLLLLLLFLLFHLLFFLLFLLCFFLFFSFFSASFFCSSPCSSLSSFSPCVFLFFFFLFLLVLLLLLRIFFFSSFFSFFFLFFLGTEDPNTPQKKGHNKLVPRRVWPKYIAANAFLPAFSPKKRAHVVPPVFSGHPGARAGQKPCFAPRKGAKKRAKLKPKFMGS